MLITLAVVAVLTGAPSTPAAVVKGGNLEVQKILGGKDASVEKLATKAEEFVDFVELAKRALGTEWSKLSKKQQEEFSRTMKELLRASYAQKAIKDSQNGVGANVVYGAEKVKGNEAEVATTIEIKKDKFPVVYKLYRASAKGSWRIYDVVTDDVSLVATYRDQFRKLIAEKGYDGLLATLKAKRDQLERATGIAASN